MSKSNELQQKNILILMSGSIACYKMCTVISQLKQKDYSIKVVLSAAAQKFIGATTIEGLINEAPITDMYAVGSVMDHIHLSRWADIIILAPATANTINKMAAGLGEDLITTLFLAHNFQKPFLLAPAMNTQMYLHPTTQKSIVELKKMGVEILETASGVLACGEIGYGRLLEPELIIDEIIQRLGNRNLISNPKNRAAIHRKKILITAGGTQEPIDDVRVITNKSTGRTAAFICDQLIESGFDVIYLHAENAQRPILDCEKISYLSFQDIDQKIVRLLTAHHFDYIIHSAAISDYSVVNTDHGKIDSSAELLTIQLKKNPKLIQKMKQLSPNSKLFGFKLTATTDHSVIEKKVLGLFENSNCDYVVQNDWSTVKTTNSVFTLYSKNKKIQHLNIDSLCFEMLRIILDQETV